VRETVMRNIDDAGRLLLYERAGRPCVLRRKRFGGGWVQIWEEVKRRRESGANDDGALEMGNVMARRSNCWLFCSSCAAVYGKPSGYGFGRVLSGKEIETGSVSVRNRCMMSNSSRS
jgi:hypothetical protein